MEMNVTCDLNNYLKKSVSRLPISYPASPVPINPGPNPGIKCYALTEMLSGSEMRLHSKERLMQLKRSAVKSSIAEDDGAGGSDRHHSSTREATSGRAPSLSGSIRSDHETV